MTTFFLLKNVLADTLKRNGKWSKTFLTMFTAWGAVLFMAFWDFFANGLSFDVWVTLVCVSLGIKVTDAWSKKIENKDNESNKFENG
jgi:hypothetical protein